MLITTGVKIINYDISYCLIVIIQQDSYGKVVSIEHKELDLDNS